MGGSNVPEKNKKTEQQRKVEDKEAHLINRSNIFSDKFLNSDSLVVFSSFLHPVVHSICSAILYCGR